MSPKRLQRVAVLILLPSATQHWETDATIWERLRHPDIRKPVQNFFYRAVHGSLRTGSFWTNIPTLTHCAKCYHCDHTDESLEHILTDCPSLAAQTIWSLTRHTWPPSLGAWKEPSYGEILACGCLAPPGEHQDASPSAKGASRLCMILLSESAHLIWVLRCDRTINGAQHQESDIQTRWLHKITSHLDIDRRAALSSHYPLSLPKMKHTGQCFLKHNQRLPDNWATHPEVLVGIKLPRPSAFTKDT